MSLVAYLQHSPLVFLIFSGLLGLVVGSFLNVVAHRLPIMMERTWKRECREWLADDGDSPAPGAAADEECLTLSQPRSRCPHCGHQITAKENIPVFSWLMLRGRCSGCGEKISPRYPLVEIITALLSVAVAWHFGVTWQAAAGLGLTWALIALTLIDFDVQLLPDSITQPLLWAGLLLTLAPLFATPEEAI
ncbi:MAG TPA: prepilin peptidase, partial [Chromatiales bacterium]|nr:prepilin peptidase [Chromatiales bacterium]